MRKWLAAGIVAGWVFGVLCGLGAAQFAGYDYYLPSNGESIVQRVNQQGWEPVKVGEGIILRRPQLRLGR